MSSLPPGRGAYGFDAPYAPVGGGGGTGEQDAEIAKAGIKKLLDALGEKK
jgi:hypothetical protein